MTPCDVKSIREEFERLLDILRGALYGAADPLARACRYALEGQGKRVRPLLAVLCERACGGDGANAFQAGLAIEMVHAYSLIHDDLPCMDNDALRRGRPTLHVAFDEATALLAGDALLTDAFRVLALPTLSQLDERLSVSVTVPAERRAMMVAVLAGAAGSAGMVLGQTLDMHFTRHESPSREQLDRIHSNKTGQLIAAACQLGAISARESRQADWDRCRAFGQMIGLAFQINDDLLDVSATMGKSSGKDHEQGKLTYLKLMSREQAQAEASRLTKQAMDCVAPLGEAAAPLTSFALSLLKRSH